MYYDNNIINQLIILLINIIIILFYMTVFMEITINRLFYMLSNYYLTVIQICSCVMTLSDRNSKHCLFFVNSQVINLVIGLNWLKMRKPITC